MIIIRSKKEGFRRCNIAHSEAPTEYADDAFTADDLKALNNEPMLSVTSTDTGKSAGSKRGKTKVGGK